MKPIFSGIFLVIVALVMSFVLSLMTGLDLLYPTMMIIGACILLIGIGLITYGIIQQLRSGQK